MRMAVELLHTPSRLRLVRARPLPDDVHLVLRVAAHEPGAMAAAHALTARSADTIAAAAFFFIEQALLYDGRDAYRALGADRTTTADDLRRNMALLLRVLHPDVTTAAERAVLVQRVTQAWNDLKTPERRAAYDRAEAARRASRGRPQAKRPGASQPVKGSPVKGWVRRAFEALFGAPAAPRSRSGRRRDG